MAYQSYRDNDSDSELSQSDKEEKLSISSDPASDDEVSPNVQESKEELKGEVIDVLSESNKSNQPERVVIQSSDEEEEKENTIPQFKVGFQYRKTVKQLYEQQVLLNKFGANLPDGGQQIKNNIDALKKRMMDLRGHVPSMAEMVEILKTSSDEDPPARGNVPPIKNLKIHSESVTLGYGAITNLHQCISSRPGEDEEVDGPPQLKVELMEHQRKGLAFFLWRETQKPAGGILADDMGLGKTLQMISLIMYKKPSSSYSSSRRAEDGLLLTNATLVVAPLTLVAMWENEIKSKIDSGNLSVFVFHGANRPKSPQKILFHDVVITTYSIVGIEANQFIEKKKAKASASNVLFKIHWNRVILDEAHTIRNHKSATSIGCCNLSASYRWLLTGTPIQNKLQDLYSLIKFLRLSPFNDLGVWRDLIEKRSNYGMKRLQVMVSSLVLRRTKDELPSIKLPDKVTEVHSVKLTPDERSVYEALFYTGRSLFMKYLNEIGENCSTTEESLEDIMSRVPSHLLDTVQSVIDSLQRGIAGDPRRSGYVILVSLLRLRQACDHFYLLSTSIDHSDDLSVALESLTLSEGTSQVSFQTAKLPNEFRIPYASTKIQAIMNKIEDIISSDEPDSLPNKCIIVSQWTTMLQVIKYHLDERNISSTKIDGSIKPKDRDANISCFNSLSAEPRIMLLSLTAGGLGLTLTAANHLFIVDMHWNPQLELQASDRCHRLGQQREVKIHRFCTEGTVETYISVIQERKMKLASDVLYGTKRDKSSNKLSLDELKILFGIQ